MIRERVTALGKDSLYNLTGLVRTFPLQPEDLPALENQFTYYTHFLGRAEALAMHAMGAQRVRVRLPDQLDRIDQGAVEVEQARVDLARRGAVHGARNPRLRTGGAQPTAELARRRSRAFA